MYAFKHCTRVTIPTSVPRYINFCETISILAGDPLVVPIGVSHISLQHKKYNKGSGRKRTKAWNKGLGLTQVQEGWICDTVHFFVYLWTNANIDF